MWIAECDVSVSKLLGFDTFPFFGWFRIQYRKNLVLKKRMGFGIKKIWIRYRKNLVYKFAYNCFSTLGKTSAEKSRKLSGIARISETPTPQFGQLGTIFSGRQNGVLRV